MRTQADMPGSADIGCTNDPSMPGSTGDGTTAQEGGSGGKDTGAGTSNTKGERGGLDDIAENVHSDV